MNETPFKLARKLINLDTGRLFQPILVKVHLKSGEVVWASIVSLNDAFAFEGGSDFTFLSCNETECLY